MTTKCQTYTGETVRVSRRLIVVWFKSSLKKSALARVAEAHQGSSFRGLLHQVVAARLSG